MCVPRGGHHDRPGSRQGRLADPIDKRALDWFGAERACHAWEPSGDDFPSPAMTEALLMSRVLQHAAFATWFAAFLPDLARERPAAPFEPVHASDRTDGQIAHLDGLDRSRAWCRRSRERRRCARRHRTTPSRE